MLQEMHMQESARPIFPVPLALPASYGLFACICIYTEYIYGHVSW
jgi:hypothetical protein